MTTDPATASVVELPSDQNDSGRSFGATELEYLQQVLSSGTLTSTKGSFVKDLEQAIGEHYGATARATSSGTSAIHAAIVALDPEPGDEIIVSPITDMGALSPVLYQGAIPTFADVDPRTGNITAATIAARLSERTRGIVLTHLFGMPCEMRAILDLASAHGIPVIEDCAQAWLGESEGALLGTLGVIGCFSMQQGKHLTSGEGGITITSDESYARRMFLFVNKAWGYGDPRPDHEFLALNGRLSELQGAVALAQFERLEGMVSKRIEIAERLTAALSGVPGLLSPKPPANGRHVYWRYLLEVDPEVLPGGPSALALALAELEIPSAPHYIGKPAFECRVFRDHRTFGDSGFPFTEARPEAIDWAPERYPGTYEALERMLVLPLNERYETYHIDYVADQIIQACAELRGGAR